MNVPPIQDIACTVKVFSGRIEAIKKRHEELRSMMDGTSYIQLLFFITTLFFPSVIPSYFSSSSLSNPPNVN
jgi:hypothetical protein